MKTKSGVRIVARESNIRRYTYRAYVSRATGKLLRIRAGCRRWRTFDEATKHYTGVGRLCAHWSDTEIASLARGRPEQAKLRFAHREEARGLLRKLRYEVERVQYRIRRRLRK